MSVATQPKKPAKTSFGPTRVAEQVIFRLVNKNRRRRDDTPEYPPLKQFPNTDVIKWNYGTAEEPDWGERAIRYLDGYQSIFVDEQEAGGREIPQNVLQNPRNKFEVIDGYLRVRFSEKAKIQFLRLCNRNVNSEHRTGRVPPMFEEYSEQIITKQKIDKNQKIREAMQKAFSATEDQIAFHAKYLKIPLHDAINQASRTPDAIKADYEQYAMTQPEEFLKTFDDEVLKRKFIIEGLLESGVVSTQIVPNKIVWVATKEEICETQVGITPVDALYNFSETKKGEAFLKKLQSGS